GSTNASATISRVATSPFPISARSRWRTPATSAMPCLASIRSRALPTRSGTKLGSASKRRRNGSGWTCGKMIGGRSGA
ncbi:MAG: hypothetical protein AVDCRST_MAG91-3748, partial [uncultured Sphingomonadaceae bacterium]